MIEQRQAHGESVYTLAQSGLRFAELAPPRGGGKIRSTSAKSVLEVIIHYSDGQVLLLDPVHKQYSQLTLKSALANYELELKDVELGTPSAQLPPPPGVKSTTERVSAKQPPAHLRALSKTMRIGPITARAYLLVQGKLRERLWYSTALPGPPASIHALLAQALGGAHAGKLGRALVAHASEIPLRIDEAVGRRWHTVLRTVRIRRRPFRANVLAPPHGYTRELLPSSSAQAKAASVPGDPIRCGILHACIPGVNGPVSQHPAIWAFYWGSEFHEHPDFVSAVNHGLEELVGDEFAGPFAKDFWGPLSQYGVEQGRLLGYEVITKKPDASVGSWDFADIELFTSIHRFDSGAPDEWWRISSEDPIFAIFVDQDEVDESGWAGYHAFTPTVAGILLAPLIHPAIPWFIVKVPSLEHVTHDTESSAYRSALDQTTERASHEFVESATDPYPFFSWADPSKSPIYENGEIADICETESAPWGRATRLGAGGTAVDPYWSNEERACVPEARPTAKLILPANGETYTWGSEVTFLVHTEDFYDGTVPEGDITWNDDKDGRVIGHGYIFSTRRLSAGVHHIYAEVTDSQGGYRTTAPVTVTIVAEPPKVAITEPTEGSSYGTDQFINFRGSAFDSVEGDLDSKAVWSVDGVPVGSGAELFKYRIPSEGIHTVTLSAANSTGDSASASIKVDIGPPTGKPSVQITAPASGLDFMPNEAILFSAAAETTGGATVAESGYVWTDDKDGLLGTGATIMHTLSGSGCEIIEHHVTVTVTDSFGRSASDTIVVDDGGIC